MNEVKVKIAGYRQLSQQEQDLINEIKGMERLTLKMIDAIAGAINEAYDNVNDPTWGTDEERTALRERLVQSQAPRWISIAKTDIETGFMAAVRAIAQPVNRE